MSEKYTTLKSLSLESGSRYPFSPDKIRILRRNEDDFTVLQIRLVNNFDKIIVNAAIDILCLPSGKVIKKVYSDFSAAKGEFFGTKVPVEAGKETVDSVEISVAEAVFEDGTVWTAEHFETETEKSVPEENVTENILSMEVLDGAETEVGENIAVCKDEVLPKIEPDQNIPEVLVKEKISLLKKIGKNKLIAGVCGAAVVVIIAAALGCRNDSGEIVSETESYVTNTSMTEITLASVTETMATETTRVETSETTTYEETQQSLKDISTEEKTLNFDGGSIECVEYKYYVLDEYESTTEYINFSAKVKLKDYPDSENAINNALTKIGNMPAEEVLMASKAPDSIGYGMMSEHNQITNVLAEGDILFITTYNLWDGGGGVSLSVWGSSATYIFNMKTGKQLKIEQLFNDFDKVKQLAVDYADKYVKENVPYDVYSTESYYEQLVDSTWYENDNWEYDGENFKVHFGWIFSITMYKVTDAVIPADVIKQYFALDGNMTSSIIDDKAGLYTKSELAILEEKQQAVSDLTGWNIAVVTTNTGFGTDGSRALRYAEDYFDEKFGSDSSSVVYLIDLDYRHFAMDGDVLNYLNTSRLDKMITECEKEYFAYDDVGNLETFYYYLEYYYNSGKVEYDSNIGPKSSDSSQDSGYYEVYQYGYVTIDSDTLNVREEPSTSAAKIGSLADGAEVYIYYYTDGWYYIYYEGNGLYGYVSSEFINLY